MRWLKQWFDHEYDEAKGWSVIFGLELIERRITELGRGENCVKPKQ